MRNKKNLAQVEGYQNRHIDKIPRKKCMIEVFTNDNDQESKYYCEWNPYWPKYYKDKEQPGPGYLGFALVIEGEFAGVELDAWHHSNDCFVYYKIK